MIFRPFFSDRWDIFFFEFHRMQKRNLLFLRFLAINTVLLGILVGQGLEWPQSRHSASWA